MGNKVSSDADWPAFLMWHTKSPGRPTMSEQLTDKECEILCQELEDQLERVEHGIMVAQEPLALALGHARAALWRVRQQTNPDEASLPTPDDDNGRVR